MNEACNAVICLDTPPQVVIREYSELLTIYDFANGLALLRSGRANVGVAVAIIDNGRYASIRGNCDSRKAT